MYMDTHSQLDMSLPGVLWISSDRDDQRMFLGLNFSILGFLGVGKFGKNFFGYSKQFEVCGSAHVGRPYSSSNKVRPKLFSGCVNI